MSNSMKAKIKLGVCRDPEVMQGYSSWRAGEWWGQARLYEPGREASPSALTVPSCTSLPSLPLAIGACWADQSIWLTLL